MAGDRQQLCQEQVEDREGEVPHLISCFQNVGLQHVLFPLGFIQGSALHLGPLPKDTAGRWSSFQHAQARVNIKFFQAGLHPLSQWGPRAHFPPLPESQPMSPYQHMENHAGLCG
jgi:hypothetical protein